MYRGKKTLGVVTARGGSKTVPGKNLRKLGGRPLVEWAASAALASKLMDRVILTSDSPEIIQAAKAIGLEAPFVRPSAVLRSGRHLVRFGYSGPQASPVDVRNK
jgi:CMP-N,N'-diacetyllegionaminic acid synthase